MTTLLWPLNRLTPLITLLWMVFAFLTLIGESYGVKVLRISPQLAPASQLPASPNSCAAHIEQYEKQHLIPPGLLHAISKVESGRKDDRGRIIAWPWTVNTNGKSFFFPTKEAAIAAVRKIQRKGISNIDVGCMQVNLHYHPHAFKTLSDAFDPAKNVAYAAQFLRGLKNEHASWHKAVAHYHSANPVHNIPYRKNVMWAWNRDLNQSEASLLTAVFQGDYLPGINHIRRRHPAKTLSLNENRSNQTSKRGSVRRIVQGDSPYLHRVKGTRKTLKVS